MPIPSDDALRIQARAMYQSDEIDFDDNDHPAISRAEENSGDRGAWVAAWVWVSYDEIEDGQEEADDADD